MEPADLAFSGLARLAELIRARASRLVALESVPDGGQAHAIAKGFA